MKKKEVVVTGVGMITSLGKSVPETWKNLMAGKSGIGKLTKFNRAKYIAALGLPEIAAEVKKFNLTKLVRLEDLEKVGLNERFIRTAKDIAQNIGIGEKEINKMPLVAQYNIAAVIEALRDANLNISQEKPREIAIAIGSAVGGIRELELAVKAMLEGGKIKGRTILQILINVLGGEVARYIGAQARSEVITSACATATHNIGQGAEYIRTGQAKIVVAGACEASLTPFGMAVFSNIKTLSRGKLGPKRASRPFDKHRDGFVMSEGAGIIILEEAERAEKRGARIYAEIAGWASTSDAFHETMGNPVTQERAMEQALKMAGIRVKDIESLYINAHGTGTRGGDAVEIEAIRILMKEQVEKAIVVSNKGQIGHAMGAAGAIETIIALKEMAEGVILPNVNLEEVDPLCQGPILPVEKIDCQIDYFLKNSFGFGGQNACLVFKRYK